MSEGRHALVVATAHYGDPKLQQLRAPAADAEELAEVLRDPEKGDFDVEVVVDETHAQLTRAIARFFRERSPHDLLLLHFSCHGVKDEDGELYLAASDTDLELLSATGISAAWLNERISRTRSRRTVVLLDCCFSGSFPSGLRPRGDDVDAPRQLQGRGRAIITASNAMEYAYEGDELKGQGRPSVFTEAVVEGLRTGDADVDRDQRVSIDDLYRYVYDRVRERTPSQTPSIKSDLEGPLYLARSARPVEPAKLDPELLARTEDRYAGIREGAVQELAALLAGSDPALAAAAREALLRMTSDDSRRVSVRAQTALEAAEDAERPAPERAPPDPPPAVPPEARIVAPRRGPRRALAAVAALAVVALSALLVLVVGGGDGDGVIPAGNLVANPSFETGVRSWDVDNASRTRERASDAPDGDHVVRVSAQGVGSSYSIDDSPDTVENSVEGRTYSATAWVRATPRSGREPICLAIRERTAAGESVGQDSGGLRATQSDYVVLRASLTATGSGNRVDVHVTATSGEEFLADAISLTDRPGPAPSPSC